MTLTSAQEQAMWRFVRAYAIERSSLNASNEDFGSLRGDTLDAARALLEVSEPPKVEDSGPVFAPTAPSVEDAISAIGSWRSLRVAEIDSAIVNALRLYREEHVSRVAELSRVRRFAREAAEQDKRTLEAMGAKNDRLEERIEKAIENLGPRLHGQGGGHLSCKSCNAIRILRGEQ